MREIEIKARVESLSSIRSTLQAKNFELSEPIKQHDVVWGLPGAESGINAPWLRLRTQIKGSEAKYLFTLKRSVTGQLDSIEHETEVTNPDAIEGIVRELGFTLYSDITKTRQKAHMGEIEICLDSVDGLGEFIEAEKLTDDDVDYQTVIDGLWVLVKEFGVDKSSEVAEGYDVLVNKKLGKE